MCILEKLCINTNTKYLNAGFLLFCYRFQKKKDAAMAMYNAGFLCHVRYCKEDNDHFLNGLCVAQMKKAVQYVVN